MTLNKRYTLNVAVLFLMVYSQRSFAQKGLPGETDPYVKNQVKNTILKNAKKIQGCYLKYLKTAASKKEGMVKMDWQILPQGNVVKTAIVSSEFQDKPFESCLVAKVSSIEFPPLEQKVNKYVAHEFLFKDEAKK